MLPKPKGSKRQDAPDESKQVTFEPLRWTTRYDWIRKLLENAGSFSAQYFECMIPKDGRFQKQSVSITIDSKDRSVFVLHIIMEPDAVEAQTCRLSVGVSMPQSDVCVSNYIFKGAKEEAFAYLNNDFSTDAILDRLQILTKKLTDRTGV